MDINLKLYFGALLLGALHSFEPGHGKSLIAAYMIGSRGRVIDGILLGLVATISHTFSVLVLGIAAKVMSRSYSEAELHGTLGIASALLVLGVGCWMLWRNLTGRMGHFHLQLLGGHGHGGHGHGSHGHGSHGHGGHGHGLNGHVGHHEHEEAGACGHGHGGRPASPPSSPAGPSANEQGATSIGSLLLLGISGGLVPCPAAITTLLAAIASGRIAEGLTVALFFSAGLGIVMMSIGVVLAHAGRFAEEKMKENIQLSRWMGLTSAIIITSLGGYTLYHALQTFRTL